MQDPVEGLDGRAGVEEGEDSQRRPQAPDVQLSSQNSTTEGDHGNFPQSCPQDSGSPAAPGTQAAPGSQGAPGSPSPGSAVGSGAAAEEAAPHSEQVPLAPGPSGDTASTTGNRLLELYPFLGDHGRDYEKIRRLKLPWEVFGAQLTRERTDRCSVGSHDRTRRLLA